MAAADDDERECPEADFFIIIELSITLSSQLIPDEHRFNDPDECSLDMLPYWFFFPPFLPPLDKLSFSFTDASDSNDGQRDRCFKTKGLDDKGLATGSVVWEKDDNLWFRI